MAQQLKDILKQLKSMDVDTSMEDAFAMVENLTEELIIKEEKIIKLEQDNSRKSNKLFKAEEELDIYKRIGHKIFSPENTNNIEFVEDDAIYTIDNTFSSPDLKTKALYILLSHNLLIDEHPGIISHSSVIELLKDRYNNWFGEDGCFTHNPDYREEKEMLKKIVDGEIHFTDGNHWGVMELDYIMEIPWKDENGEDLFCVFDNV